MTPDPAAFMLVHENHDRAPGLGGVILVQPQTYEITFAGQAGAAVCAEFDDCAVTVGPGTTTLRVKLPDQGALEGLVERITCLGLTVVYLDLLGPSLEP
jgi:hypothetical protein